MSNGIGERIKKLRMNKDWSLRELENRTGINYSVLSRIESGKRPVTDQEVNIFADLFEVTTDYLHGRTEKTKSEDNISSAFHDFDNLTEEEKEYLDEQLEIFRKFRRETLDRKDK